MKALCVGIDNYPGDNLTGCIRDATAIGTILGCNGDGSPNFEVRIETDIQTRAQLKNKLQELFSGNCETALFYFSGHGFVNELGGFLVTPDAEQHDEGVSMDNIMGYVSAAKEIRNKIIILDCCYAGKMGVSAHDAAQATRIENGVTILTACRENEASVETDGHGIFTSLLIDALQGGAADLTGCITPGGIYAFIDQALGLWGQRPMFKTNITRFTSLRKVTPQVELANIRKIVELFPESNYKISLNPSFEYTNSKDITHTLIEPLAKQENVEKFRVLQKLQSIGLIVPLGASHMYFAAMESKSCKLTALGAHYWQLVKDKRI